MRMPTGYTAKLYEGKPQTFEEFALAAAHGLGALVEFRDSSMDAPIPVFRVSEYAAERVERARQALDEIRGHDLAWWVRRQRDEVESIAKAEREADERRAALRARYEEMLARVEAWVPPTSEHVGLKDFMRDQLRTSIQFDAPERRESWVPKPRTVTEYRDQLMEARERELRDALDALLAEQIRVRERNGWVDDLFVSLGIERAS